MLHETQYAPPVGPFDDIPADAEASRFDEIEFKVAQFTDQVVHHPGLARCENRMRMFHKSAMRRRSAPPPRGAKLPLKVFGPPRGMLITGLTGTGKSTISRYYEEQYPRYEGDERMMIPVLRIELPGQPRANVIAEQMLLALGDPFPREGSGEFRMERAKHLIGECGTSLIIIDEVQHVTDNLDARTRDIAADTLKNLMSTGIPIVFIGLPTARAYFTRNQQLGRRCTPKIRLAPFEIGNEAGRKAFQGLLKSLHLLLPTVGPSALIDSGCTLALYHASFGLLGQLTQLIEAALRIALTGEDTTLKREHLEEAFVETIFPDCGDKRNPFSTKFDGKPLTRPDDPYHGLVA